MSRVENGFHIIVGWLIALLLLPFYPIAYLVGWADEVVYRRSVMRDIRSRTRPTTPTRGSDE